MKLSKHSLCLILLLLVLSLTGCGKADSAPEAITEAVLPAEAPETAVPVEHYLDSAQTCIDQGDYDGAIAILEQALVTVDDPQLSALLAELTAATPLTLEYNGISEETVKIHSFTAEETYGNHVRYTLDYTAAEGMLVQVQGKNMLARDAFTTTGERGCFMFEIDAEDVRTLRGVFQLQFTGADGNANILNVQTRWPGEAGAGVHASYEVSYLLADLNHTGNVQMHSFAVHDAEDRYRFSVEYTAVEGLKVEGLLETPDADLFLWDEKITTTGERETLEFEIAKDIFASGEYMEVCFTADSGEWVAANFTFPMRVRKTAGQPLEEPYRPGYILPNNWSAGFAEVHDCFIQRLDNGFVRYTLDLSAPIGCFVSILGISGSGEELLDQFLSCQTRQQFVFDIPGSTLAQTKGLSVLLGVPRGRSQHFEIPSGFFSASTEGTPVSDPVELEFYTSGRANPEQFQVLGCTAQLLDNGFYRYTVEVNTLENTRCSLFDPPDGDTFFYSFVTGAEAGNHTFCFDVEAEAASSLAEITFSCVLPSGHSLAAVLKNTVSPYTPEPIEVTVISFS